MKKVLIVIRDMKIGGAQKSLLTFLQCLASTQMQKQFDIHLMVIDPQGAFLSQIPKTIQLVEAPRELRWLSVHMKPQLIFQQFTWRGIWGEICWLLQKGMKRFSPSFHISQKKWKCWKPFVPENRQKYDVAVSYIDGCPNYYVMDKVKADKKVLWVHSEYQKQGYDSAFDRPFFEASDAIVTISSKCEQCIAEAFPQCADKVHVLENITSYEEISRKSKIGTCVEFAGNQTLKLLTVGRLHTQKGIDLAIGAAKLLKEAGKSFLWLVVGEGAERAGLQALIDSYGLSDSFYLVGSRENPYSYIAECDMIVQPSRVEGKSIVLDEAKMLCKPIVVTNYATVKDSVMHGESGWIVDMTEQAICEGIVHMYHHPQLRKQIVENLNKAPKGNEEELERYVNIMF